MISRTVKIQLAVFAVLAVLVVAITGIRYVGLDEMVRRPFVVKAYFTDSGNVFRNAEVTYRGVTIGKVKQVKVASRGAVVELSIKKGQKVPKNTKALVEKLSAVGEQYVDLQPQQNGGPYLKDGDQIPYAMTSTPISETQLLTDLNALVASVPKGDLVTTVDELDNAFSGLGPDLQRLIDRGNEVITSMQNNLGPTVRLIEEARVVLQTQNDVSPAFRSFAHDIANVAETIRDSDSDLRRLMDNGVVGTRELQGLLQDLRPGLPVLLANLITMNQILDARLPGIDNVITLYPTLVEGGFAGTPQDGSNAANFALVGDRYNVCRQGYRQDWQPGPNVQPPPNDKLTEAPVALNLGCKEPINAQVDVRGSRNAPRPPGDTTDPALGGYNYGNASAQGGSSSSSPSVSAAAAFDPDSGIVQGPNGQQYLLGADGGQAAVLGADSWKYLLLAPLTS